MRVSHINKADKETQKQYNELNDQMKSLTFTDNNKESDTFGKTFQPRGAIVEVKVSENKVAKAKKIAEKFNLNFDEILEVM